MKHYSRKEWKLFIDNHLDELQQQEMQEHLIRCDDCLTLYNDLLEEASGEDVIMPVDFVDRLMELIHKENAELSQKNLRLKRINTFIYYSAAASITLFLTSTGIFQAIYQGFTSDVKFTSEVPQSKSLFMSGWTDRLTEETSRILNGVKNQK